MITDSTQLPAILKPEELADFLRISKTSVYRLVEKREIITYTVGKSLRFKKEDINNYLNQNCDESVK